MVALLGICRIVWREKPFCCQRKAVLLSEIRWVRTLNTFQLEYFVLSLLNGNFEALPRKYSRSGMKINCCLFCIPLA